MNRILNCNERLYKWNISENNKCFYCNNIDTLEHHLFNCKSSKNIWNGLETWLYQNLDIRFNLTECEVIFGIPYNNTIDLQIINFIILLGKHYINKRKTKKEPLYIFEILQEIKTKIEITILTNCINDRENPEWQTELQNIL